MNRNAIRQTLQSRVPDLLAIYAFGSRVQCTDSSESDLDLAVLVAGYAEPLALWELAGDPTTYTSDFTRQDAAILNIQRACDAARGVSDLSTGVF